MIVFMYERFISAGENEHHCVKLGPIISVPCGFKQFLLPICPHVNVYLRNIVAVVLLFLFFPTNLHFLI